MQQGVTTDLVSHKCDPRVVHVQPGGDLAISDDVDVTHPRRMHLNRTKRKLQLLLKRGAVSEV